MKIAVHCDALGNPVELGKKYGWSGSTNGFSHVIVGTAGKFTEHGVTINVQSGVRCLGEDDPKPTPVGDGQYPTIKSKINIKGIHLFPVS